jgi:predicted metal-dependent hydrolase
MYESVLFLVNDRMVLTMKNSKEIVQKEIQLNNQTLLYSHTKNKRSKTVRLAVYRDGRVVITTPLRVSEYFVNDFIQRKASWIIEKIEHFKSIPIVEVKKHTREQIDIYKKQVQNILEERLPYFSAYYGVTYKNVAIKNITSRWGSCSSKGNLNFNYKIALLTPELADYIIVHELCHLKEMNHGEKFWNLVEEKFPNHKELRRQLRAHK